MQETSSNNLFNGLQEEVLNKDENVKNIIYPVYAQNIQSGVSTINNLLKNEEFGESEQVLLNGAYNLISNAVNEIANIVNSGNVDYSAQQQWLQQAAASIEAIKNGNVSMQVLDQQTQEGAVFAPLRQALENTETFQSYQVYGEIGAKVIRSFARYISVLENVVFQQFVRFNVTSEKLQNSASSLMNLIQKGANFFNCASLAVSKYLDISRISAVIQNLAADISLSNALGTDSMNTVATNVNAEVKVLKTNGLENTKEVRFDTINNFTEALQVGEKAIFTVYCYNLGGHSIAIKRESNGWGVFDTNRNGGEEVIYTPENFITLMTGANGTTVQGMKSNGETFTGNVYYTAITSRTYTEFSTEYVNGSWQITPIYKTYTGVYTITDSEDAIALAA